VLVRGTQLRRYALAYEDPRQTLGVSRLASVSLFGVADEGPFPAVSSFAYTPALGASCGGAPCASPTFREVEGRLPFSFAGGAAEFVDLNGDALPDVLDTRGDLHRIHELSQFADGRVRLAPARTSRLGSSPLSSRDVQVADFDGNGLADLVDTPSNVVFFNDGRGDWARTGSARAFGFPSFSQDKNLSFLDFDNDKKIDLIHSDTASTYFYATRDGSRLELVDGPTTIGAAFHDGLVFADVNGDGMLDAAVVTRDVVRFRTNLGLGRFAAWSDMAHPTVLPPESRLVDLDGDGRSDLVHVEADRVVYSLLRADGEYAPAVAIASSPELPFPTRTSSTTIRHVDMNGNGSTDIVWIRDDGTLAYLDLLPTRAHLLRTIRNGIGGVVDVTYGTAALHMARDGGATSWKTRLPHAVTTVDRVDERDGFSGRRKTTTYRYRDGYFDPREKRFNGFATAIAERVGGHGVEGALTRSTYDVGIEDADRRGLLLSVEQESGGALVLRTANVYRDCPVDGAFAGEGSTRVRFFCLASRETTHAEKRPASEWVRTEERYRYDGYGNRTRRERLGDVARDGDEVIEETAFLTTPFDARAGGGLWRTGLPLRSRVFDASGAKLAETIVYYDGEPFVGAPEGVATAGLPTRVRTLVDPRTGRYADVARFARDAHGAVIEERDADGAVTSLRYDEGSLLLREEVRAIDSGASLAMVWAYDPVLETVVSATGWQRRPNPDARVRVSRWSYDAFGRPVAHAEPGGSLDDPNTTYRYELGPRGVRTVTRTRIDAERRAFAETVACADSAGRLVQTLSALGDGQHLADGFVERNALGLPERVHEPYTASTAACEASPPQRGYVARRDYDGLGREVRLVSGDAHDRGGVPSVRTTVHGPLWTATYDEEEGALGLHAGAKTVVVYDGLGRLVQRTRGYPEAFGARVDDDAARETVRDEHRFVYDALGRLVVAVAPGGAITRHGYDGLGRLVSTENGDSGVSLFRYSDAGDLLSSTDARGATVERAYDGAHRLLAVWDAQDPLGSRVTYAYDAVSCGDQCTANDGTLARVRAPARAGFVEDLFGDDVRGRRVRRTRILEGKAYTVEAELDDVGAVVAVRYPEGHAVRYERDGLGRVVSIPGVVERVAYDERGARVRVRFANGVETRRHIDALGRIAELQTVDGAGKKVLAYRIERDRVGRVLAVHDARDVAEDDRARAHAVRFGPAEATYAHDALGRLVSARFAPDAPEEERVVYGYDRFGNLDTKQSTLTRASAEHAPARVFGDAAAPHRLTSASDVRFEYDPAGHLVARGGDTLVWDAFGRLAEVRTAAAAITRSTYLAGTTRVRKDEVIGETDAKGFARRALPNGVTKTTLYVDDDFEMRDGVATLYVRLGGERVARLEFSATRPPAVDDVAPLAPEGADVSQPDGVIDAGDAYVLSLRVRDGHGAASEADVDRLLAESAKRCVLRGASRVSYVHTDHLGSTTAVTNDEGAVEWHGESYPFGLPRSTSHAYEESYTFTGQERDGSGLFFFGARHYDPWAATWVSVDPKWSAPGVEGFLALAPYAYASQSPTWRVDPDGYWDLPKIDQELSLFGTRLGLTLHFDPQSLRFSGSINVFGVVTASSAYDGNELRSTARFELDALERSSKGKRVWGTDDANAGVGASAGPFLEAGYTWNRGGFESHRVKLGLQAGASIKVAASEGPLSLSGKVEAGGSMSGEFELREYRDRRVLRVTPEAEVHATGGYAAQFGGTKLRGKVFELQKKAGESDDICLSDRCGFRPDELQSFPIEELREVPQSVPLAPPNASYPR
jgi:RHS repeat-associated protein